MTVSQLVILLVAMMTIAVVALVVALLCIWEISKARRLYEQQPGEGKRRKNLSLRGYVP